MGCRWLVSTETFADLVMNTLGLEFILGIDELLLTSIFPELTLIRLQNTKLAAPCDQLNEEDIRRKKISMYHLAVIFVLGLILWVTIYLLFIQRVLPGYEWDIPFGC